MKKLLKRIETEHHYEVSDAPDTQQLYGHRLTIRPNRVVIRTYDGGFDATVIISGLAVRRDGSLGATHTMVFSSLDPRAGRQIPAWVDEMVTSAGLSWDKSDGAK